MIADEFGSGGSSNNKWSLAKNGSGTLTLSAANTYSGATAINAGTLILTGTNTYTGGTTISAGTLQIGNGGASGTIVGSVTDNGTFAVNRSDTYTFGGVISGGGAFQQLGTGTTILTGANSYTGGTTISAGILQIGNRGTNGTIVGNVTDNGTFAINRSDTYTFGGVISAGGAFQQLGPGTTILTSTNTYTGATSVNGGVLEVDGSIATSSLTSVNSGGTLTGAGTVGDTQINNGGTLTGTGTVGNAQINGGGTFAPGAVGGPGTALTVSGNLAFQSGALYLVQLSPTNTTSAKVSGTATLAGSVQAVFAPGSYVTKQYTILQSAGLSGTFGALSTSNLPSGFATSLSYTNTDVILNLTAALGIAGLSGNQSNVAGGLNNFFNDGGTLPPGFLNVFNLSGASIGNALSQLSGEAGTGAQSVGIEMMNSFLSLLLDPHPDAGGGRFGPAVPFAPEREAFTPEVADAYAKVLKAPPLRSGVGAVPEASRYSVWGAAYGGANSTSGDPAGIGSHDTTSHTGAFAAGLDYRPAPDTVVGFALAGGGASWSLAAGLGGGRSDVLQAGAYGARQFGNAYLAGALGYSSFWTTTNRTVTVAGADQLTSMFDPQGIGGRLEGGTRVSLTAADLTPYAALQAQSFFVPAHGESATSGSPQFALAYNAQTATAVRSEIGSWAEHAFRLPDGSGLKLFGRLAWAHDWQSNPALGVTFLGLPAVSFVVNGATPPSDLLLLTAGAEWRWHNGWTLLGKLDGEFADRSQTYTGTAKLQHIW